VRAPAAVLLVCLLALASPSAAIEGGPASSCFLIVGGLGGEPDYEQRFVSYTQDLEKIARAMTSDPARVIALSGKAATRSAIQGALEKLARGMGAPDTLVVFLIGHGSFDGTAYKFNIPGPDLSGPELRALLDKVPAGRQLIVAATSSSGAAIEALARENRVVVTATRSGAERNATVFGRYWVEALRDPAADGDKTETISALEAFKYAEEKVKRFYADQNRLVTEHPRLEGKLAGGVILSRLGSAALAATDPAQRKLLAQRESLEQQIDAWKLRKAALPTEQYRRELERLLLELAKVQGAIEAAAGR